MAFANFAAYQAQYLNPQVFDYHHTAVNSTNYGFGSWFSKSSDVQTPIPRGGSNVVAAPTTAVACDSSTVGAMIRPLAGAGDQIIVASLFQPKDNLGGGAVIIDRLSHQAGLSGTTTTAQTTNLPTAALTRYTSGVGVYAALEIYSALGSTDALWTVVYTNQAGTGSRSVSFVLTFTPSVQSFIFIPLQGTDTGVRSVESVTLTPSTGTAGNFGVTLFKPLAWLPGVPGAIGRPADIFDIPGWNTPILDDACLQLIVKQGPTNSSIQASMRFGES